jgi:predicted nucleic acid-binding protein
MILVVTSIWIDHGRRRDARLAAWLTEGLVLGHPFVQGELACGKMPRRADVLALFEQLPAATLVEHRELLQFVDRHRLMGQGLGWIDLHLLASALASRATLATRDRRLARAAQALGAAAFVRC